MKKRLVSVMLAAVLLAVSGCGASKDAEKDGEEQKTTIKLGVRCVLSKLMLSGANFLIFDEPTNHLDMESITALNDGMKKYKGILLFTSHDHQLTQTVANKIIDISNNNVIVRECTYDEYLEEQSK